jgi:hypothetical protein
MARYGSPHEPVGGDDLSLLLHWSRYRRNFVFGMPQLKIFISSNQCSDALKICAKLVENMKKMGDL